MRQQGGSHEPKDRWSCRHHEHRARCVVRHRRVRKIRPEAPPSTRACAMRSSARTCRAWSRWSRTASACSIRAPSAWRTSRPDARSTADALFRIASMTKPVTSLALMQLIEQGRIGLDDPVEKYLPEFARLKVFESFDATTGEYRLRPASRPLTVRHVLTHSSGSPIRSRARRGAISSRARAKHIPLAAPCCSIPASAGTTARAPMWSEGWSRSSRARSSRTISASTSLPRSRCPTRPTTCRRTRPRASSPRSSAPATAWMGPSCCRSPQPGLTIPAPIGGGGLASTAATMGASCACSSTAASSTGRACSRPRRWR